MESSPEDTISSRAQEAAFEAALQARYEIILTEPGVKEALDLLDTLPEDLFYHDKEHTLDVIRETVRFCMEDGVDHDTLRQQAVAAAWHDVGFIDDDKNNEDFAIERFKKSAIYQDMSEEAREETIGNINDTRMYFEDGYGVFKKIHSKMAYMLDADVSNFGRKDFFLRTNQVALELGIDMTQIQEQIKFYKKTLDLLEHHTWRTEAAQKLRENGKQENIRKLRNLYESLLPYAASASIPA